MTPPSARGAEEGGMRAHPSRPSINLVVDIGQVGGLERVGAAAAVARARVSSGFFCFVHPCMY